MYIKLCAKNEEGFAPDFVKIKYLSKDSEIAMLQISEQVLDNVYAEIKQNNFDIEFLNYYSQNILLGLCFMAENIIQHEYSGEFTRFIYNAVRFNDRGVNIYFWGRADNELPAILLEQSPFQVSRPPWHDQVVPDCYRNKKNSKNGFGLLQMFKCLQKVPARIEISWYKGKNQFGESGHISKIFIELKKAN